MSSWIQFCKLHLLKWQHSVFKDKHCISWYSCLFTNCSNHCLTQSCLVCNSCFNNVITLSLMRNSWLTCQSCIKLMWGWNNFFWTIQMNHLEAWTSYCVMIFISCLLSVSLHYTTLYLLWKLSLLQSRNFIKDLMKLFSWLKSCISRVRTTALFNSEHFYRVCSWVKWLMRTVSFCSVTTWAFTDVRLLNQIETSVFKHLNIYVATAVFVLTFLLVLF